MTASILLYLPDYPELAREIASRIRHQLEVPIQIWPNLDAAASVELMLVWGHVGSLYQQLPALKAVQSYGAGVDHLLRDPYLPPQLTLCRSPSEAMAFRMRDYCVAQVLAHQFQLHRAWRQQQQRMWLEYDGLWGKRVVLLGYGAMGRVIAQGLSDNGCYVQAWRQQAQGDEAHAIICGQRELGLALTDCDFLINVLPLTAHTEGVLNCQLFEGMHSAVLINVGRGRHLVQDDLLWALEQGHLSQAVLDVVDPEPLPPDHPFWQHDQIQITPHISGISVVDAVVEQLIQNWTLLQKGQAPEHRVDRELGY